MNPLDIRQSLYQCLAQTINVGTNSSVELFDIDSSASFRITLYIENTTKKDIIGITFATGTVQTRVSDSDNTKEVPFFNVIHANISNDNTTYSFYCKTENGLLKYYITGFSANDDLVIKKDIQYGEFDKLLSTGSSFSSSDNADYLITNIKKDTSSITNGQFVIANDITYVQNLLPKASGSSTSIGSEDSPFSSIYSTNSFSTNSFTENLTSDNASFKYIAINGDLNGDNTTVVAKIVGSVSSYNIYPASNQLYDIGSSSLAFNNLFVKKILLNTNSIDFSTGVINFNNTTSSEIDIKTAKVSSLYTDTLTSNGSSITLSKSILLSANNSLSLGNSSNLFNNIYSNKITSGNNYIDLLNGNIAFTTGNIQINSLSASEITASTIKSGSNNINLSSGVIDFSTTANSNIKSKNIQTSKINAESGNNSIDLANGNIVLANGNIDLSSNGTLKTKNLEASVLKTTIIPEITKSIDFGSSSNELNNIYTNNLVSTGSITGNLNGTATNANLAAAANKVNNKIKFSFNDSANTLEYDGSSELTISSLSSSEIDTIFSSI